MSYCRWSSDDGQCDVYVYADVSGGYTTHVASARVFFTEKLPEKCQDGSVEGWVDRQRKVMEISMRSEKRVIGLQYDGQSFNDETGIECSERLIAIRAAGYNVPQYAIDALREEVD